MLDDSVQNLKVAAVDWMDALKSDPERSSIWREVINGPSRVVIAADVVR